MHVGVVLPQVAADWDKVTEATEHAESVGADSVWVIDHVLGFPPPKGILEAWTVMSAVAASTRPSSRRWPPPSTASRTAGCGC
jgi:alkanesulfonate monooxygenase SsuD/methylene tetrahydromethanopterin reductase-like flavin-dependent oxidoreductase (luciferase family)